MQRNSKQKIRLQGSNRIYEGNISIRIDRFQLNKKKIKKEIVEHLPSVGIIPITDDQNIILVVQYRHATGKTILEIPAGKIENDETPVQAAFREMTEEIGYTGNLAPLSHWYLAPGYSTEMMQIFIATNLKKLKTRGKLDEDENITIKRMKLNTAVKKCIKGEIEDCKTVAALLTYAWYQDSIQTLKPI